MQKRVKHFYGRRYACKFTPVFYNPFPNRKFLDWFKLKAFADDKIYVTEKLKFVLGTEENMVGKGVNAGDQQFLLFPTMFSKGSFSRVVKTWDCVVKELTVEIANTSISAI